MSLLRPAVLGAALAGLRRERAVSSPRFKDGRFENTVPVRSPIKPGATRPTMTEFFFGGHKRVPTGPLPVESPLAAWSRPAETGLRATWLGHSTTLLEIDGVRVLTDPVWGERASPSSLVGPRRFHRPPVAVGSLPALDVVLVSHDHYDHLDYPTIRELAARRVPFVTSLGVGAHLEEWGVPAASITELDWWETHVVSGPRGSLGFRATPSRHFSGRGLVRNGTLWSSWVLEGDRHKVFFSGDTGLTDEFVTIGERCGPFDLVMLEVGAFHPSWGDIHLGAEGALEALAMLGGGTFLPVHWGTFDLALHPWDEPAEIIAARAERGGLHVVTRRLGRPIEPMRVERIDPWWREVARSEQPVPVTAAVLDGLP